MPSVQLPLGSPTYHHADHRNKHTSFRVRWEIIIRSSLHPNNRRTINSTYEFVKNLEITMMYVFTEHKAHVTITTCFFNHSVINVYFGTSRTKNFRGNEMQTCIFTHLLSIYQKGIVIISSIKPTRVCRSCLFYRIIKIVLAICAMFGNAVTHPCILQSNCLPLG